MIRFRSKLSVDMENRRGCLASTAPGDIHHANTDWLAIAVAVVHDRYIATTGRILEASGPTCAHLLYVNSTQWKCDYDF